MDVTLTIPDDLTIVLQRITGFHNRLTGDSLTPRQFFIRYMRHWLTSEKTRFEEKQRTSYREAYNNATPEEQAQIDAILDRYRQ